MRSFRRKGKLLFCYMNARLLIATHKLYEMPQDPLYRTIQVGAVGKKTLDPAYLRDDEGDCISDRNPYYCELTAVYWAWKNLDADAYGVVQYRRYLAKSKTTSKDPSKRLLHVLDQKTADALLKDADAILPKKRKYYIETLLSHYDHTIHENHMELARELVKERCPEYLPYVDKVYGRTWGYMFNMFLMKREYADRYCAWIFDILFALEPKIDVSGMSAFHKRLYGRVSEILFNAWLLKEQEEGMRITELPVISIEPENWWKKGTAFLKAKFLKERYEASF